MTGEGTLLGILQYMAPEQLEGQQADVRSDIFAFGLVLYEMISGKRPFTGKSQASLIAAILRERPQPLTELQPLTPAALDRVIGTFIPCERGVYSMTTLRQLSTTGDMEHRKVQQLG